MINKWLKNGSETFFLWDIGLSRLTSSRLNKYHNVYRMNQLFLNIHPPIFRITAHATVPGQSFLSFYLCFDPLKRDMKNILPRRSSNLRPFSCEPAALPLNHGSWNFYFVSIFSQPSPSFFPGIVPVKGRQETRRSRRRRPKREWTGHRTEKTGSNRSGNGIRRWLETGNNHGGIRGQRSGKVRNCFPFCFKLSENF